MARSSNQDELQEMINRGRGLLSRRPRLRPWQGARHRESGWRDAVSLFKNQKQKSSINGAEDGRPAATA